MDPAKTVAKHFKIAKFVLMQLPVKIVNLAMFSITVFANFVTVPSPTVEPACLRQNVTAANLLTLF